jgi:hypothetical protein
MDPWTRFWRRFQTEEQRRQGFAFVPTEYNNIRIDERNFIWGTISALVNIEIINAVSSPTSSVTAIRRLNPLGTDILKRRGDRGVWGDVSPCTCDVCVPSRIVDVAIGPAGMYTLLDARRGRMFKFNDEGIMLFAFGNMGTRKGNFRQPVSIGYIGNNIAVLDTELSEIIIFEPTLYGELLIAAETHFVNGEYELAHYAWAQAAEQNANFQYAFFGLGNARFNERRFPEAMAYFMHAGGATGVEGYSRARDMMRRDQMENLFPILSAIVVFGALAMVGWLVFKGVKNYAVSDDIIGYSKSSDDE